MLTFDLGVNQRLRQTQARRLVRQRAILADAALDLTRCRREAGRVLAADGQPVDADAMFDAAAQRLGGQLRETVEQNGIDAAHGVFGFGLVARTDHEAVAAATDLGALGDDVQGRAVAVGRKETHGIAFGFALLADLFGQADGGEGTAGAEPFVVGDGRPFDGLAEAASLGDGGVEIGAGRVVDGDADGDVGGVIADAAFGNGLSEGFFEEEGVGDDLQAIGGPGVGLLAVGRRGCPRLCS